MLRVVEGCQKERPVINYERIYLEAISRTMEAKKLDFHNKELAKRTVFYIVKYFDIMNLESKDLENLESLIIINHVLTDTMKGLTPKDLMTIFPPMKTYDGAKWGEKDYFTTMSALKKHGLNEPFRTEEVASKILWDYMNKNIMEYQVKVLSTMSNLARSKTGKGLMEMFIEDQGLNIPVYNLCGDINGKSFLVDENGRSYPVTKKTPRYLKLAK